MIFSLVSSPSALIFWAAFILTLPPGTPVGLALAQLLTTGD